MTDHRLTEERIAAFRRFLGEQEKARDTIEKYLGPVRDFVLWTKGSQIAKETVSQWKAALLDKGYAPATVNGKLAALNGLFSFLGWDDCRTAFLKLQKRVFRDDSLDLTQKEYQRLLGAAGCLRLEWMALLMETICATGIRVSEVKYITAEAAAAGRTDVYLKGKIRTILLPRKLSRKLMNYAKKKKITSGPIFRDEDGKSLSRYKIWRLMKKVSGKAKVASTKVFPHNLRHLFAATFYRVTGDIVKLADVLGHSSVETTRIYLMTTGAEHMEKLEQLGLVS